MITFYQFARTWDIPNLSHFCCKTETYLRMTELPYTMIESVPFRAPKGKLPYIKDGDKEIADSRFIIAYLKETYGDQLDKDLNAEQRAVALARMIEEHLFWGTMYTRWQYTENNWRTNKQAVFGDLPPIIRDIAAIVYRHLIKKQIYGQGTGRHGAEEIFQLYAEYLSIVAVQMDSAPIVRKTTKIPLRTASWSKTPLIERKTAKKTEIPRRRDWVVIVATGLTDYRPHLAHKQIANPDTFQPQQRLHSLRGNFHF